MAQSHSFVPEPWSSTDQPELAWLYNTGSVAQALAYSELFWPSFTEHDDCVFLLFDLEKYESWMKTLEGNKTRADLLTNLCRLKCSQRRQGGDRRKEIGIRERILLLQDAVL